jgi:hypothetical protein
LDRELSRSPSRVGHLGDVQQPVDAHVVEVRVVLAYETRGDMGSGRGHSVGFGATGVRVAAESETIQVRGRTMCARRRRNGLVPSRPRFFLLSANAPLPMILIIFSCEPKDSETRQEYTAMDLGEWQEGRGPRAVRLGKAGLFHRL